MLIYFKPPTWLGVLLEGHPVGVGRGGEVGAEALADGVEDDDRGTFPGRG